MELHLEQHRSNMLPHPNGCIARCVPIDRLIFSEQKSSTVSKQGAYQRSPTDISIAPVRRPMLQCHVFRHRSPCHGAFASLFSPSLGWPRPNSSSEQAWTMPPYHPILSKNGFNCEGTQKPCIILLIRSYKRSHKIRWQSCCH